MNKYEYLFGFGTEGVEKVFADSMFALIVIVFVAFALGKRIAAAKEKKQDPEQNTGKCKGTAQAGVKHSDKHIRDQTGHTDRAEKGPGGSE